MPLRGTETSSEEEEEEIKDIYTVLREWLPVFVRMLDVVAQWEELRQQDIFVSRLANRLRQMLRNRAESPVTNNSIDQRDVFTNIEDNGNLDGNENTEFIARDTVNF